MVVVHEAVNMKSREISAITYMCGPYPTTLGLCHIRPNELFRHKYEKNAPYLLEDGGKYGVTCDVRLLSGPIEGYGLDDPARREHCERVLTKPNPDELNVVGRLIRVEFTKGGAKDFSGGNYILAISHDRKRLYIVKPEDVNASSQVLVNPQKVLSGVYSNSNPNPNPNPESLSVVTDPNLAKLVQYNLKKAHTHFLCIEEHMGDTTEENPVSAGCIQLKHGPLLIEHHLFELAEHLQSAGHHTRAIEVQQFARRVEAALENRATSAGDIRNLRNEFREKFMRLPKSACSNDVCSFDRMSDAKKNPVNTGKEIVLWASKYCLHCRATEKALDEVGITSEVIYAEDNELLFKKQNITVVPVVDHMHNGVRVARHVGQLDVPGVKSFIHGGGHGRN
jgi:glutaredoxin